MVDSRNPSEMDVLLDYFGKDPVTKSIPRDRVRMLLEKNTAFVRLLSSLFSFSKLPPPQLPLGRLDNLSFVTCVGAIESLTRALFQFDALDRKLNLGLRNLSFVNIKSAYRNKRVMDMAYLYAEELYKTGCIRNPQGLQLLIKEIESSYNNVAVKGKLFELAYALEYAKLGSQVQFGSVEGKGGDVVVFNANELGYQDKTTQIKYLTGVSEKKFKDNCRIASEQLGPTRKGKTKTEEMPDMLHLREIIIVIENPLHPVNQESKAGIKTRLRDIFRHTPKSKHTDLITIASSNMIHQFLMKDLASTVS